MDLRVQGSARLLNVVKEVSMMVVVAHSYSGGCGSGAWSTDLATKTPKRLQIGVKDVGIMVIYRGGGGVTLGRWLMGGGARVWPE